jgi:uncharacterized protein YjbJ (UPF0337 family)
MVAGFMTMDARMANRWNVLRARAKNAWGRLTADQWLQLEGQREARASQFQENPAFAPSRRPYQSQEMEGPVMRGSQGTPSSPRIGQAEVRHGDA